MKKDRPALLVVDDEQNIRRSLELTLGGEGFEVRSVATGEDAIAYCEEREPDAVFLDVHLPGIDGLEVLSRLREAHPDLAVVMISGHATVERAVEATRRGAFDFVEKPFSRDRIVLLARNAVERRRLHRENLRLRGADDEILGESEAIERLRREIERVAVTEARVLIRGESGTGKELVARRLHARSARRARPFLKVNCAAIPEELIEAELFGAVKGAYTGADADREGVFAAADGGSLLLDEIGDMSLRAQVKVLRVLQEGEFEAVGSTRTQKVDVRVFAATHQDLTAKVRDGSFREDLYFRLNVVPLEVPPLRAREGDVARLADHFLASFAERHGRRRPTLSPGALRRLEGHPWPGNVRELANVLERLLILAPEGEIDESQLPAEIRGGGGASSEAGGSAVASRYDHLPLREAKRQLEIDLIEAALARQEGNVTRAASDLGLERTHLHKRIKALGIETPR